ncbi:MAG: hypothetical protein EOO38_23970 [Cytophagaceae bacterium]|nr:MAG: hypothetical protein EOO38_23970 [Cytophagaceae bacterium]
MILTLQIDKVSSGEYRVEALYGGLPIAEAQHYKRINEAIRRGAVGFEGSFDYLEVRYAGFSSGTFVISVVTRMADTIADRLMELIAHQHHSQNMRAEH